MTWETLWAVGRYDLRLTSEEFWGLVPRQFMALLKRARSERQRREYGPALIVTAIQSLVSKKRLDVTRFMPSYTKTAKDEERSWQDMQATLGAAVSCVGSN